MIPKKKRIINRELLDSYHSKPCIINKGCMGQVVAHHIKTKGSGGDDIENNLWALCMLHHKILHDIGHYTFCIKFGLKTD